ncbi:unnamed protein product [Microthlaspi erraticum]|uniref:Uncharacterized protein n=1 Tax=Microthlaspi erraticum TaxID=1685480 RepID=A0A6D2HFX2_9BRAS|nr:unnamed protein product [Microthlaspi erraticum]
MRYNDVEPVVYNFTYLLKVCGDEANLRMGKEIHGLLVKSGFSLDLFAMTGLENMYEKRRQVHEALKYMCNGQTMKMAREGEPPCSARNFLHLAPLNVSWLR